MAQFEEDTVAGVGEMKTGKAAIAERKKKRREGQVCPSCEFLRESESESEHVWSPRFSWKDKLVIATE